MSTMGSHDLQKQKLQIQQNNDQLVDNIELKLEQLRAERKKLQSGGVQSETVETKQQKQKQIMIPTAYERSGQELTYAEFLRLKKQSEPQSKRKLQELEELYNKKKQLQAIGMKPASVGEISRLHGDKKIQRMMEKHDPEAERQKQQIIQEQMARVAHLLKKKKVTNKERKHLQETSETYYKVLMMNSGFSPEKIVKYELMMFNRKGKSLSLLQKEQVIDLVFEALQNHHNRVDIVRVKEFLLSNQNFCDVFYFTQEEIFNDLEVLETEEGGVMTRNQFYEFVKSIEISNPMLNPSMKMKKRPQTSKKNGRKDSKKMSVGGGESSVKENKINVGTEGQQLKQYKGYLLKVFQYFDGKRQRVIEREKFISALKRGFLIDLKKHNLVKKEKLNEFADFLSKIREQKNKKKYYMQVEGKFIGWIQVEEHFEELLKGGKRGCILKDGESQSQNKKEANVDLKQQLKEQKPQQKDSHEEQQYQIQEIRKGNLQEYFEEFGWNKDRGLQIKQTETAASNRENAHNALGSLNQFDQYAKKMHEKYANNIEWQNEIEKRRGNNAGSFQSYREEFKQLQSYIEQVDRSGQK